ncbi:MAG: DUF4097 family beta strand repeat protein [Candidatus Cloacimonetes bacterium]|nr:DUF4097 family beta strand repeat protein [Candidatus Cloacimonadota bacterium]
MIQLEKMYKFETKSNLVVEFGSENFGLEVIGWEKETSEFFIKLDFEKANDKEITIENIVDAKYNKKKNTLNIKLNEPENIRYMNSRLELKVPHVTEIIAKTENGGISIENLHGIQTVTTENGAISMDHVNGDLVCRTENGAMNILDCNSNAKLQTENGAMKMKNCEGNLNLKSENGAYKLIGCKGSLELKNENGAIRILDSELAKATIINQNGSIYYEFTSIEKGQFKFENENGKIHLIIPDEVPYKIEARNEMGRFHVGLEGNYDRRKEGNKQVIEMVKGSGKVEISVKNKHGSISFMNHPMKEGKFRFDMSFVSDAMDKAMENIPDEYFDKEKIIKKIEKAKKKMKNIKMPDMKNIMAEVMTEVKDDIKNVYATVSSEEFKEKAEQKINEGISKVMEKVQEKAKEQPLSEQERDEVNERSRLKILQMLQDGKITADEADRLIEAMEG